MKTVIIGGVAGGATAATRLRRLDEQMEIVVLERGSYISYANCGLPYYIGDVIQDRNALLVQTVEGMQSKFNIDVRIQSEATKIDPKKKIVTVSHGDETYEESYDELILAPGSSPIRPPIPGIDLPGIIHCGPFRTPMPSEKSLMKGLNLPSSSAAALSELRWRKICAPAV